MGLYDTRGTRNGGAYTVAALAPAENLTRCCCRTQQVLSNQSRILCITQMNCTDWKFAQTWPAHFVSLSPTLPRSISCAPFSSSRSALRSSIDHGIASSTTPRSTVQHAFFVRSLASSNAMQATAAGDPVRSLHLA